MTFSTNIRQLRRDQRGHHRRSEEVVKEAARNQAYGEQIVTILLKRLKDETRKSIAPGVVEAAAGNCLYGAQIMEKLLKVCGDAVCENLSFAAICTTAENVESGALILDLLLKADEEKVSMLIMEVCIRAAKGEVWATAILPKLDKRREEIRLYNNRKISDPPRRQIGGQLLERSPTQLGF